MNLPFSSKLTSQLDTPRGLITLKRTYQPHYEWAHETLKMLEMRGDRVIWISDHLSKVYLNASSRINVTSQFEKDFERVPDLSLESSFFSEIDVALLLTELATRELTTFILLEGAPLKLINYYPRLRWVCARFALTLVILQD